MFPFADPQFRRAGIPALVLTAALSAAGFLFLRPAAGFLLLALGLALIALFTAMTARRYRDISRLIDTIDHVLDDGDAALLSDHSEGELAILESELHKMTIRLREQTFALQKEKIFLTDAIADISHQLRTPLTTINLSMTFLRRDDLSEAERRRHLRMITANLERIDWLVATLLKMARIDAGTAEFQQVDVDLAAMVREAVEPLLVPMELRDQTYRYEAQGGERFRGDHNWTREAIGNILKNCMEHTPQGGTITAQGSENAVFTQLVITDTGPGFRREDLPHLFERFYRGAGSGGQGVGIGLAMARMILHAENGTIKAENAPGGGARFIVRVYKGKKSLK